MAVVRYAEYVGHIRSVIRGLNVLLKFRHYHSVLSQIFNFLARDVFVRASRRAICHDVRPSVCLFARLSDCPSGTGVHSINQSVNV